MEFHFCWPAVSNLNNRIASWDTKFETGTKTALLQPFSPIVIAADENERIRYASFITTLSLSPFPPLPLPQVICFGMLSMATEPNICMMA